MKYLIVCVNYNENLLSSFLKKINIIRSNLSFHSDIYFLHRKASNFSERNLSKIKLITSPIEIDHYIDEYLDYSAYKKAMRFSEDYDGMVFLNDTIVSKHASSFLTNCFTNSINKINNNGECKEFPIIIGPQFDSEYFFSSPIIPKQFIPTYLFFINKKSYKYFFNIISEQKILRYKENTSDSLIKKYIPFIDVHREILFQNFKSNTKLERKLSCCIAEREITKYFSENGLVYFIDIGILRKIIINLEKNINVLMRKYFQFR